MSLISRRSLDIRSRMRRRSVSILVSPGPRRPTPPPLPPARPPACRDIDSPQPRSRGSMYCIWASSTCALPSRLVACWAKMSRISAVRSMTLTLTAFSSAVSWPGESSPSQITVSAPVASTTSRSSCDLARADVGGRVGLVAALDQPFEHLRAGGLGQRGQLGHAGLGVGGAALGPHPDQHDALQAQLAVLDLGDVGEFGGQPGDPAQRRPVLEGEFAGAGSASGTVGARVGRIWMCHRQYSDGGTSRRSAAHPNNVPS